MNEQTISLGTLDPLVQKAILESLTPTTRERLITDAITYLITPKRESWNSAKDAESPLQTTFRQALWKSAETVVQRIIEESPEYQAKIREIVDGFLGNLDKEDYDTTLMEVVTLALVRHFKASRS